MNNIIVYTSSPRYACVPDGFDCSCVVRILEHKRNIIPDSYLGIVYSLMLAGF